MRKKVQEALKEFSTEINQYEKKAKKLRDEANKIDFNIDMSLPELKAIEKKIKKIEVELAYFEANNGIDIEDVMEMVNGNGSDFRDVQIYFEDISAPYWEDVAKILESCRTVIEQRKKIDKQKKKEETESKKAYGRFDTKAESKEYAEFQAHKIVSAAFDKVFRR